MDGPAGADGMIGAPGMMGARGERGMPGNVDAVLESLNAALDRIAALETLLDSKVTTGDSKDTCSSLTTKGKCQKGGGCTWKKKKCSTTV